MGPKRLPTIRALAVSEDPFDAPQNLLARLKSAPSETQHLEWKGCLPVGRSVSLATKVRMAKSVFAFANTEGGFIVFGVDRDGRWVGLPRAALADVDPSQLTELFNSYATPEVRFEYRSFEIDEKWVAVLHVPPSRVAPHVTTKRVEEKLDSGQRQALLARHAVYVRYEGKSDVASPSHYERIIRVRTDQLKRELLRRIREVPVGVVAPSASKAGSGDRAIGSVTRVTSDPSAPAVRVTRDAGEASGVLLHERLAADIFDDTNIVLEANDLLARGQRRFVFGEQVYYRVYAERQHVARDSGRHLLLAESALSQFYAPHLFWLLGLGKEDLVQIVCAVMRTGKNYFAQSALRLVVLLGPQACAWLGRQLQAKWGRFTQPPEYVFSFDRMQQRAHRRDRRLQALRMGGETKVGLPGGDANVSVAQMADSPSEAASALSKCCMAVFSGDTSAKGVCRQLDVLAYGSAMASREGEVVPLLVKKRIWGPGG